MHPRGVSDVWQTQGLETDVFESVAMAGLTGEFSDLWQGKELEKRKEGNTGRKDTEGVRRTAWRASMVRRALKIVPTYDDL